MIKSTREFWTKAYQKNIGKLIAICYRYTSNYQLSEDLAHDAFLKAIDKASSFRGEGEFDAWLRRIVVNHVLQHLRDQKKYPYLEDLLSDHADNVYPEENSHLIKSMEFTADELLEIINQLPEHHRLVFNLYVLEKFTHVQIGEELGISEGTSKSHLARARKKLKQLLALRLEQPQKENDKKRVLLPLFVISDDTRLDQMINQTFDHFSIPPKQQLSLDQIPFPDQQGFAITSFIKSYRFVLAGSAVVSIFLISYFILGRVEPPVQRQDGDQSPSFLSNRIDTAGHVMLKKSSSIPSATNLQDSVIAGRNLKLKSMKPLDSLALMLVLASSSVNTSSMRDSVKNEIEKLSPAVVLPSLDPGLVKDPLPVSTDPDILPKETGTFRASKIYWLKESREIQFEGKVSVNFKEQHFRGQGSFNFLGKVQLLIVEGQQVEPGNTVQLSNDEYHLAVLNPGEAISKYGDRGRSGAVEISRAN